MPSKTLALGAAMLGLAVAAPVPGEAPWGGWNPSSSGSASASAPAATWSQPSAPAPSAAWSQPSAPAPSGSGSASGAQIKSGNPFSFPLDNGFPNLSAGAKQQVSVLAHGIEPNGGAPTLDADDITSFQLVAFNEIFEVAFFTDLLFNVTNNVPGFGFQDQTQRQKVIDALVAIQAQEGLHADNANAILTANNVAPIQPCKYQFPTTNLADAIGLASTFTDVVLGTLQDVQLHLATNAANGAKTAGVVPIIGSVIGQEGEQNGFFRSYGGKIPSAKPFLTRATREFAFSALNQNFIVAGSCPNSNTIKLPVFQQLNVVTQNIQPQDQLITYSVKTDKPMPPSGVSLVLINGQEIPLVNPLQNVQVNNGVATFQSFFNFTTDILDGLTIAALTNSSKNADGTPFASAEDVAKVTIAGPGLIEIL